MPNPKISQQTQDQARSLIIDAALSNTKLVVDKHGQIKTAGKLDKLVNWLSGIGQSTQSKNLKEENRNIQVIRVFDKLLQQKTIEGAATQANDRNISILRVSPSGQPLTLQADIELYHLAKRNPESSFSKGYFKQLDQSIKDLKNSPEFLNLRSKLDSLKETDPSEQSSLNEARSTIIKLDKLVQDRLESVRTAHDRWTKTYQSQLGENNPRLAEISNESLLLGVYQGASTLVSEIAQPHAAILQSKAVRSDSLLKDSHLDKIINNCYQTLSNPSASAAEKQGAAEQIRNLSTTLSSYGQDLIDNRRGPQFKKDLNNLYEQVCNYNLQASTKALSTENQNLLLSVEAELAKLGSIQHGTESISANDYLEVRKFATGAQDQINQATLKKFTEATIGGDLKNPSIHMSAILTNASEVIRNRLLSGQTKEGQIGGIEQEPNTPDFIKGLFKFTSQYLVSQTKANSLEGRLDTLAYRGALERLHQQFPTALVRHEGLGVFKPLSFLQIAKPNYAPDPLIEKLADDLSYQRSSDVLEHCLSSLQNSTAETDLPTSFEKLNALLMHVALSKKHVQDIQSFGGAEFNPQYIQLLDQSVHLLDQKLNQLITAWKAELPKSQAKIDHLLHLQAAFLLIGIHDANLREPAISQNDLVALKKFELGLSKTLPLATLERLNELTLFSNSKQILSPLKKGAEAKIFELLAKNDPEFVQLNFQEAANQAGVDTAQAASRYLQQFLKQYLAQEILNPIYQLKPHELESLSVAQEHIEHSQILNQAIKNLNAQSAFPTDNTILNTIPEAIENTISALHTLPKIKGQANLVPKFVSDVTTELLQLEGEILASRNLNPKFPLDPKDFVQISRFALESRENIPFLALEKIANYRFNTSDLKVDESYSQAIKLIRMRLLTKGHSITQQISKQISTKSKNDLTVDRAKAIIYSALVSRLNETKHLNQLLNNPSVQEDEISTKSALEIIQSFKDALKVANVSNSPLLQSTLDGLVKEQAALDNQKVVAQMAAEKEDSDSEDRQANINRLVAINSRKGIPTEFSIKSLQIDQVGGKIDFPHVDEISKRILGQYSPNGQIVSNDDIDVELFADIREAGSTVTYGQLVSGKELDNKADILAIIEPTTQKQFPPKHPLEISRQKHWDNLVKIANLDFDALRKKVLESESDDELSNGFAEMIKAAKSISAEHQALTQELKELSSIDNKGLPDNLVITLKAYQSDLAAQMDRLARLDSSLQSQFSQGLSNTDLAELRKYQMGFSELAKYPLAIPFSAIRDTLKTLESNLNEHTAEMLNAVAAKIINQYAANGYESYESAIIQSHYKNGNTSVIEDGQITLDLMDWHLSQLSKNPTPSKTEVDQLVFIRQNRLRDELELMRYLRIKATEAKTL